MNIKTLEELENQAWNLRVKLNRIIEAECIGTAAKSTPSVRKERLYQAHARAYSRFLRRQDKRFS